MRTTGRLLFYSTSRTNVSTQRIAGRFGLRHWRSALCRRVVTGNDGQLPRLSARYAGHFSPFVNARISARPQ
jgi:hypothetical protein